MRHTARETAFQLIYQIDFGSNEPEQAIKIVLEEGLLTTEEAQFCTRLVRGVIANQDEIDQLIQSQTQGWTLDRMMSVNRNILRLAVYEIVYCPDIPNKVAIDEAIEFAKIFGDDDSRKFVNSILDKVLGHHLKSGV